nr:MAG TPA: hypothetical protein [Caudoviricetes sp.]
MYIRYLIHQRSLYKIVHLKLHNLSQNSLNILLENIELLQTKVILKQTRLHH